MEKFWNDLDMNCRCSTVTQIRYWWTNNNRLKSNWTERTSAPLQWMNHFCGDSFRLNELSNNVLYPNSKLMSSKFAKELNYFDIFRFGDTINTASRMESHGEGTVLVQVTRLGIHQRQHFRQCSTSSESKDWECEVTRKIARVRLKTMFSWFSQFRIRLSPGRSLFLQTPPLGAQTKIWSADWNAKEIWMIISFSQGFGMVSQSMMTPSSQGPFRIRLYNTMVRFRIDFQLVSLPNSEVQNGLISVRTMILQPWS